MRSPEERADYLVEHLARSVQKTAEGNRMRCTVIELVLRVERGEVAADELYGLRSAYPDYSYSAHSGRRRYGSDIHCSGLFLHP